MTKIVLLLYAAAAFAGSACFAYGTADPEHELVSVVQLIANPDRYDGKLIRVIGVSRIEFEGTEIWSNKEHYTYRVHPNGLWIVPDYGKLRATSKQLAELDGKYVIIEGRFEKENRGHRGLFGGAIENVTRFEPWEEEDRVRQAESAAEEE